MNQENNKINQLQSQVESLKELNKIYEKEIHKNLNTQGQIKNPYDFNNYLMKSLIYLKNGEQKYALQFVKTNIFIDIPNNFTK